MPKIEQQFPLPKNWKTLVGKEGFTHTNQQHIDYAHTNQIPIFASVAREVSQRDQSFAFRYGIGKPHGGELIPLTLQWKGKSVLATLFGEIATGAAAYYEDLLFEDQISNVRNLQKPLDRIKSQLLIPIFAALEANPLNPQAKIDEVIKRARGESYRETHNRMDPNTPDGSF